MQLGEFIQRVQSLYSKGVQSKDTRLTVRHIYSTGMTARSTLLGQQAGKNQYINQWAYQTIPCMEMIKAAISECRCIPSGGCTILRSKHRIPKPIAGISNHLVQYITTLDGSITFDEDNFNTNKYNVGNKYTSLKPQYYFKDNYLFITVRKELKVLTMSYLADDIVDVYNYPSACECDNCGCGDIMEIEFPMDGRFMSALIDIVSNELINAFKSAIDDKSDDASDDTASVIRYTNRLNGGQNGDRNE